MSQLCFLKSYLFCSLQQRKLFFRKHFLQTKSRTKNLGNLATYQKDRNKNHPECSLWKVTRMQLKSRGVFEQKRTLISALACFITGIYSAPLSLLVFGIPAKTAGAPSYLTGLFSVFISAALELLSGKSWTGTQIFAYFCFVFCVLWDSYDDIRPVTTKVECIEPMKVQSMDSEQADKSEEDTNNTDMMETQLNLWDEKFRKTLQSEENGDQMNIS
ncbi:hypothetical protein GpartN1_g2066.t1 [Galdieria partita]|uniref:Uncharacterized protein n=1 Tax=Galdieria partita TaxID=83374 RepID=A0A9C7PTS9_9RHOD|nr:hypothetical protein GpartN1_g2066.t1 [Galdieria partita]